MNTIQSYWEIFNDQVLPQEASEEQRESARRTFYAGAVSLHQILIEMHDGILTDEARKAILTGIFDEMEDFIDEAGIEIVEAFYG